MILYFVPTKFSENHKRKRGKLESLEVVQEETTGVLEELRKLQELL